MAEMTLAAVARGLTPRVDQPGVFSGYASLFGTADRQGDKVERGAFRSTLEAWRAQGRRPAMLWQHDASEPIGLWTDLTEDEVGLRVEGRLLLSIRSGQEAYELLLDRAAEGGARRALAAIGLEDGRAAADVRDLRELLAAWRQAKRAAWQTAVRFITTVVLAALLAGLALKAKLGLS
jgi:hypothetical protein